MSNGIPLAAGVLYPLTSRSVSVVTNAPRLRRVALQAGRRLYDLLQVFRLQSPRGPRLIS